MGAILGNPPVSALSTLQALVQSDYSAVTCLCFSPGNVGWSCAHMHACICMHVHACMGMISPRRLHDARGHGLVLMCSPLPIPSHPIPWHYTWYRRYTDLIVIKLREYPFFSHLDLEHSPLPRPIQRSARTAANSGNSTKLRTPGLGTFLLVPLQAHRHRLQHRQTRQTLTCPQGKTVASPSSQTA